MRTRLEAPAAEPHSSEQGGPSPERADLTLRALGRTYPAAGRAPAVEALASVDLDVVAGRTVAVVGPSGCGKSTLLELTGGLQDPDAGRATVAGGSTAAERLAACAHMPQRDLLLP